MAVESYPSGCTCLPEDPTTGGSGGISSTTRLIQVAKPTLSRNTYLGDEAQTAFGTLTYLGDEDLTAFVPSVYVKRGLTTSYSINLPLDEWR